MIIAVYRFREAPFSNFFHLHENTKPSFSNSLSLKLHFRDGLEWTVGLIVEKSCVFKFVWSDVDGSWVFWPFSMCLFWGSFQYTWSMEAAWPSGWNAGFENRSSQVQIPFWPLADVVLGSPEFNISAALVNSQLIWLLPVGIPNLVMFILKFLYHCLFALVLKSPNGAWPIKYTYKYTIPNMNLVARPIRFGRNSVTSRKRIPRRPNRLNAAQTTNKNVVRCFSTAHSTIK